MSIVQEFKEFAVKGNVVDLAVGVIIGGAFGKIVDSVVADLIMPLVGRVVGGLDFSNYFIALKDIPPGVAMTLADVKKAGIPFAVLRLIGLSIHHCRAFFNSRNISTPGNDCLYSTNFSSVNVHSRVPLPTQGNTKTV